MGFSDFAQLLNGMMGEAAAVKARRAQEEDYAFKASVGHLQKIVDDEKTPRESREMAAQAIQEILMEHLGYSQKIKSKNPLAKAAKNLVGQIPQGASYGKKIEQLGVGSGNAKAQVGGIAPPQSETPPAPSMEGLDQEVFSQEAMLPPPTPMPPPPPEGFRRFKTAAEEYEGTYQDTLAKAKATSAARVYEETEKRKQNIALVREIIKSTPGVPPEFAMKALLDAAGDRSITTGSLTSVVGKDSLTIDQALAIPTISDEIRAQLEGYKKDNKITHVRITTNKLDPSLVETVVPSQGAESRAQSIMSRASAIQLHGEELQKNGVDLSSLPTTVLVLRDNDGKLSAFGALDPPVQTISGLAGGPTGEQVGIVKRGESSPSVYLPRAVRAQTLVDTTGRVMGVFDPVTRETTTVLNPENLRRSGFSQTTIDRLISYEKQAMLVHSLEETYEPAFTGPIDNALIESRATGILRFLPFLKSPEGANVFRRDLAALNNAVVQLLAGATVPRHEEDRVYRELPIPSMSDAAFADSLRATRRNVDYLLKEIRKKLGVSDAASPPSPPSRPLPPLPPEATSGPAERLQRLLGR